MIAFNSIQIQLVYKSIYISQKSRLIDSFNLTMIKLKIIINSTMLKSFDFFRKIQTDQELTSATGGIFTIVSLVIAGLLIVMSLQDFYQQKYYTFLAIKNDNSEYLPMRIDITFNKLPCQALGIEFHDELEYKQSNLQDKITLFNIPKGATIGEEYKRSRDREAEKQLLTRHLHEDYQCRVQGILSLPKTPGTLSFTVHAQDNILWEIDPNVQSKVKLTYRMDSLNFGLGNNVFDFPIAHKSKNIQNYIKYLEGDINNRSVIQDYTYQEGRINFLNHIKIIPVVIQGDGKTSASENYRYSLRAGSSWTNEPFPKVMFMTEIEPINIVYRKHEPELYELVRQLLAIVGGTVATIGLFNSVSHFLFNIK